ncbi:MULTISPECIES: hypothetical protein [unclassified Streptomyces]|uniref:hypothetical protein n=1 Tax=unclassified Streptomyces TaxID=2593676 RepID=UPI00386B7520
MNTKTPARAAPLTRERSLTRLIRQAAITSILDGTERITKTSLETILLDHLAETNDTTPDR